MSVGKAECYLMIELSGARLSASAVSKAEPLLSITLIGTRSYTHSSRWRKLRFDFH